jgi:type I restriction enzyme R subunit
VFKTIKNKMDFNEYALFLNDIAVRTEFYQKLTAFSKCLKMAFGSLHWEETTPEKEKSKYSNDLKFFVNLRNTVVGMYSDEVNFRQYEKQLQKLLDQHVTTSEIIRLTEQVDIFNEEAFKAEVEKLTGTAAQAETIASRTAKHISEHMDEDPVFYKKLSELIQQTIADYRAGRIAELEFLKKVKEQSEQARTRKGDDMPDALNSQDVAQAFYRLATEILKEKIEDPQQLKDISIESALGVDEIIRAQVLDNGKPIIDWVSRPGIIGKLKIDIGDYLIDEIRDKYGLQLSFRELDEIAEKCIDISKKRYAG